MESTSLFRSGILSKAWSVLWTRKSLWFFGLFAAILSFGEEYDLLIRNSDILGAIPRRMEQFRVIIEQGLLTGFGHNLSTLITTNAVGTLGIVLSWLIAVLAVAWLVIVSQSALIEGARRHEMNKSMNLIEGFDVGMANFWPMFLLNLVTKVLLYGSLLIVNIPLVLVYLYSGNPKAIIATMLWTFIIFFPGITVVSFVTKFASAYIVIKRYQVREAIAAGWGLFTRYWLVTLELAIILVLINFAAVYIAVSTLVVGLGFPKASPFGYVVFIAVLGFLFSWLTTFQFASWVNLFFRLEQGNAPSKIQRIIHYILGIRQGPSKPVIARAQR